MHTFLRNTSVLTLILLLSNTASAQFYQGSYQEFGKNRVQYNGFSWKFHAYKRFRIYYSGINENVAIYTARTMHHYLNEAEEKLDYNFPEKLDVIVYESQQKFRQSNLGVNNEEYSMVGGSERIVGSKIFMYYEGDHQSFNENIKGAVYQVLLKHMFFGGDWKDQLKSSVNSGIPDWLERGLIEYFVREWDADIESRVKDLILTGKIDKFNDLTEEEKTYAGIAIWNYIAETHGNTVIPNIIYITRVTKNVERGFHSLLGMDFSRLTRSYISFYRSRYIDEYESQNEPKGQAISFKHKRESVYYSAKISPDGTKLAYVENKLGRYRVKVLDTLSGKVTKVYAGGTKLERIQDYSFPVITWHPSGDALTFFAEVKGELKMFIYTFSDQSLVDKTMKMDKVLDFGYATNGDRMVFSGVIKGQTDLYIYNIQSQNIEQITDDIYDDLNPQFVDNDQRIIFASNRPSDTIFKKPDIDFVDRNNDLFIFDLKDIDRNYKYLERVTNTEHTNETEPYELTKGQYVYLSDKNGLYNRFIAKKDSAIAFIDTSTHYSYTIQTVPLTNFVTSIKEHDVNRNNESVYMVFQNSTHKIIQNKVTTDDIGTLWTTTYRQKQNARRKKLNKKETLSISENDTIYTAGHKYQKEVVLIGAENSSSTVDTLNDDSLIVKEQKWQASRFTIYDPNFSKDFVLSQFDNNFLFPNYQPYSGPGSVYFNPGMNMLLKIGGSDLFDDYKILGGVRIPMALNSGGEFLLMVEHLRDRVDHRLIFYRQKTVNIQGLFKWLTHDIRYRFSFPFSEVLSLRTTVNVRKDKQIFIPFSDNSLVKDNQVGYNSGLKTELVFDNTIPMELNIRRGFRGKLFAEYLQELGGDYHPTFNFGVDLRHYTRIKRNFIWVNRIAGATSLGSRRLLYYLGGVDNWVLRRDPDFDQDIQVDPSQNFGFQTIATPMRGFIQNKRNGNSFALFNTELRLPVFTFFSTYPIKSDLVKHFQLVAFGDVGVAWTGPHPFHPDNYFNTQIIEDKPVTINIENLREPIIGGFGLGVRTKIWGYFIRLDAAWGVEDFEIQKPLPYLSLTKDI
ncbi:MAG: hypothetical protein WDZ35_07270 [Crocinitomicaceae bacterium]